MFFPLTATDRTAPSVTDSNTKTTVRWQRPTQECLPFLTLHPLLCLSYKLGAEALIKKECKDIIAFLRDHLIGLLKIIVAGISPPCTICCDLFCWRDKVVWVLPKSQPCTLLLKKQEQKAQFPRGHSFPVPNLHILVASLSLPNWKSRSKLRLWCSKIQFCLQCWETLN